MALLFFFWRNETLFFLALLVSIDHSHSTSRHKPSQKFNMRDFVASSQAFVAKAVIACDHWCPYILRHRALLCVLLTHVWKPGLTLVFIMVIGQRTVTMCVRVVSLHYQHHTVLHTHTHAHAHAHAHTHTHTKSKFLTKWN